jgi:hypothetical protein
MTSRRRFLGTAMTLAATAGLGACGKDWSLHLPSPGAPGDYRVGRWILGETPATVMMPVPRGDRTFESSTNCPERPRVTCCPDAVRVYLYFPAEDRVSLGLGEVPIDRSESSYPVILYAHARRMPLCAGFVPPGAPSILDNRDDFKLVDTMLEHAASHGCVIAVPDLSAYTYTDEYGTRAAVLVALYQYLKANNQPWFANRLDMHRLILAGHSMEGGACLTARGELVAVGAAPPVAMVLIAPAVHSGMQALATDQAPNALLVMKGAADHDTQASAGVDADGVYANAGAPRGKITIPGANHFGYTNLCSADNRCAADDAPGGISLARSSSRAPHT